MPHRQEACLDVSGPDSRWYYCWYCCARWPGWSAGLRSWSGPSRAGCRPGPTPRTRWWTRATGWPAGGTGTCDRLRSRSVSPSPVLASPEKLRHSTIIKWTCLYNPYQLLSSVILCILISRKHWKSKCACQISNKCSFFITETTHLDIYIIYILCMYTICPRILAQFI